MRTIKVRRDTAERWARLNPILFEGEPGFEKDTGRLKIGDGYAPWLELPYFVPGEGPANAVTETDLLEHVEDPLPHIAYDDGPSFTLLYENAKV